VRARAVELDYVLGAQRVRALTGVDMDVPPGQFVCIRGRSGSGKSSLLHVVAGLRRPTAGVVRLDDVEVSALTLKEAALMRRRMVGVVFQFFNLLPMLSVAENVAFPLSLDATRRGEIRERVDELLEELGIPDRRDHYPDQLSGGEMQRVAIARALVIRPRLLLADEPTGNLDAATGNQIWALLRSATRSRGVTTLMVTHEPEGVSYADRVVVLEDGRVIEDTLPCRLGEMETA
jgi:putative ABC transport system ATP-binding protein